MKFGKHLQTRQLDIPEYAASFVNYKALKKLIKQLSATPLLVAQSSASVAEPFATSKTQTSLQANRDKFFFRLERELEKVNAFYLQKEAELKLRLQTLLDRKRAVQNRNTTTSKLSVTFVNLQEGFQQFCNDLNKLQQFVDINNTAFAKILKKWDKTSKSRTKELYLSRAVEVQPCFNREVISEFSDQATTSLQELVAWAEGESISYSTKQRTTGDPASQLINNEVDDIDAQVIQAAKTGNVAILNDSIEKLKGLPDACARFSRILLAAYAEAPEASLQVFRAMTLIDWTIEDEINGRNFLHEAAISGNDAALRLAISLGVSVVRADVYGRLPLHYACMYGHVTSLELLLTTEVDTLNAVDLDNLTPLIHSIVHQRLECVRILLAMGARIEPGPEIGQIPLNLACKHGFTEIVKLLLERKAQLLPDAEGLYPQHLVARSGRNPETLLDLKAYGADLDQRDKLYQWTPLLHAAAEGHVECLQMLIGCKVDADILDEKGYSAIYYATWEGHLECMQLLNSISRPSKPPGPLLPSLKAGLGPPAHEPLSSATDVDGIPDFTLPPPIIPLRRYGHNFLDNKTSIQLTFDSSNDGAIVFYQDSKYPAARLTISPKSSEVIPRNIMLPLQEDSRIVTFQIDSISNFNVDFDIYPTFGSRIIARSVALPAMFNAASSGFGTCCLPLFDTRLRAVGQISFAFHIIEPFRGMPLDITHFATYWRATTRLDAYPSGPITGSSLTGEFVQIFVQVTADGRPVLCPHWKIDHHGLRYPLTRLTYDEYIELSKRDQSADLPMIDQNSNDVQKLPDILAHCHLSLGAVLAHLPTSVHLNIEVLYPPSGQEQISRLHPGRNMNKDIDAILGDVFEHARLTQVHASDFMRPIVFSSYNPDVCTALNWKQPNYPVLLRNDLGASQGVSDSYGRSEAALGRQSISIKEAVRTAQSNNFMGLICTKPLLYTVKQLIGSIKDAGLVLIVDDADGEGSGQGNTLPGTDGTLRSNGILRFNDVIGMS